MGLVTNLPWNFTRRSRSRGFSSIRSLLLLRCIRILYQARVVPVTSSSFLKYICTLTPKLLSFLPLQKRTPSFWNSRLQQTKSRDYLLQFPALFQILMSPRIILAQSIFYSKVRFKNSQVSNFFPTAIEQFVFGMCCYY